MTKVQAWAVFLALFFCSSSGIAADKKTAPTATAAKTQEKTPPPTSTTPVPAPTPPPTSQETQGLLPLIPNIPMMPPLPSTDETKARAKEAASKMTKTLSAENISEWDDWALYSVERNEGFAISFSGGFTILSPQVNFPLNLPGKDYFGGTLTARGFYGWPEVPFLQAVWLVAPSFATATEGEFSAYAWGISTGPGIQFRFVRFPPLAPIFIGVEFPIGFNAIIGNSDTMGMSWGPQYTGGIELAFERQQTLGVRFCFNDQSWWSGDREHRVITFNFEYRYYWSGNR